MTDPLSSFLIQQGYQLSPHYWQTTQIEIGIGVEIDNAVLIYKVEETKKRVLIVKILRKENKKNLGSPFKPIILLAKAACKIFEHQFVIEGKVSVFSNSRLNNERSEKVYQLLGARKNEKTGFMSIKINRINQQILNKFK